MTPIPNQALAVGQKDLVQRESGLIVPADLAGQPDAARPGTPVTYDPDGRLRTVLTKDDQAKINRAIRTCQDVGFAFIMVCRNDKARRDGKAACGQPAHPVPQASGGPAFECLCTRVHFI